MSVASFYARQVEPVYDSRVKPHYALRTVDARTSAGVTFEDRGGHALKGVAEPQRVFAVRAAEGAG